MTPDGVAPDPEAYADAAGLLAALRTRGETLGVAESLTGGLVVAALVAVPGASAVVRGGVVAYATDLKASVLGVDPDLLAAEGAVHPEVARQMAVGVRRVTGADWGLSTTGVAGPEPQDGRPVGRVHVGAAGPDGVVVRDLDLDGDRQAIREAAVVAVLALLADRVAASGVR